MQNSKETIQKQASANVKPQEVYRQQQQQERAATAVDKVALGIVDQVKLEQESRLNNYYDQEFRNSNRAYDVMKNILNKFTLGITIGTVDVDRDMQVTVVNVVLTTKHLEGMSITKSNDHPC